MGWKVMKQALVFRPALGIESETCGSSDATSGFGSKQTKPNLLKTFIFLPSPSLHFTFYSLSPSPHLVSNMARTKNKAHCGGGKKSDAKGDGKATAKSSGEAIKKASGRGGKKGNNRGGGQGKQAKHHIFN